MGLLDQIREGFLGQNSWPPRAQRETWAQIELHRALRRTDETRLKQEASVPWHRAMLFSPVPRMISRAKANLLYGEPPEIMPANEADADVLERIASENGLDAELHRAAMIASSEREVWGRVSVDPSLLDVPIIEFWSRGRVIPHFRGRFVAGATFITEWEYSRGTILRMLETYEPGAVRTTLHNGSRLSLGAEMSLEDFEATRGRQPEVLTGIDYPLVAFIPNTIDDPPTAGYSDYQGIEARFQAINESATIGQENIRLAGKKRALVDAAYLRHGRLPAGDDIFIRNEKEVTAGEGGKPLQMLEYDPGTDAVLAWLDATIDTTLTFGGTAPQLVGRSVDGGAISGTALKLKMIHSLMEAGGTGRFFDRGTQRLLRAAAIIDSRPTTQGGFGRRWQEADADASVARGDGLPRDDMEAAQWLTMTRAAEAISDETAIAWLHPDWTEEQREEELDRLQEQNAPAPTPPFGDRRPPLGGPPAPGQLPAGETPAQRLERERQAAGASAGAPA